MLARLTQWLLIRPGEGRLVAYLSCLFLIVGLGMAVGRSSSDALLFKRVGVEFLPQMFFLTSILLALFSAAYAEFADRVSPARLFRYVAVVLTACLLGVWYAMTADGARAAFAVYFLIYGVASEILLVHVSLYAAAFLNATQSKRLLPIANAASRLGGVIGGVGLGLASAHISLEHAALFWVVTLGILLGALTIHHRGDQRDLHPFATSRRSRRFLGNLREGLQFARSSPLLRLTGLGLFVMVVLIAIQDYLVSTILTRHFTDERDLAAFFGWFFAFTNLLVLLLQLLATNRLLRRFGLKAVSLIFPWSTAFTFGLLAASASVVPAVLARFNYTGMLPAFRNPAANLFYNALPNYMQGRARALTTGVILPLGLAASGVLLMLVPRAAVGESLAVAGLALSFVYLYLKVRKNRIYSDTLINLIQQQVFVSNVSEVYEAGRLEPAIVRQIDLDLGGEIAPETFVSLAELLMRGAPSDATRILLKHLPLQAVEVQDRLLLRVAALAPAEAGDAIRRCLHGKDAHLQATALRALESSDPEAAVRCARAWLDEGDARLRGEAVRVALSCAAPDLADQARGRLADMIGAAETAPRIAALKVVGALGLLEHAEDVRVALDRGDAPVRAAAVQAAAQLLAHGLEDSADWIDMAMRDPVAQVRRAALAAAARLPGAERRLAVLAEALQDDDPDIRRLARECADSLMPRTRSEYKDAIIRYAAHFRMQGLLARGLAGSGIDEAKTELTAMALDHLTRAWEKKSVCNGILNISTDTSGEKSAADFLGIVLDEEVDRHLDLALEILGHLDETRLADTARAALASRDPRICAQAVESLRHLHDEKILVRLLPLLEARHDGAVWTHRTVLTPNTFASLIGWCRDHGGVWLQRVAATLEGEQNLARTV